MANKHVTAGGMASRMSGLSKVATGIRGLDTVLDGGLPAGRTTLFSGGPGTGKSMMAMEFLYRGALEGYPGLFVSFEERAEDLRINASAMGMHVAGMEEAGKLRFIQAEVPYEAVKAGAFDIHGLLAIIRGHTRALGAKRLVLDAIDVLMRLFGDSEREREELHVLHDWLKDEGLTALMTVKSLSGQPHRYPFLDFMADCVLLLDQRMSGQVRTRRLNVIKYRGSGFLSNEHPYVISPHGVVLIPVSSMSLDQAVRHERMSSGCEALDECLGGGYRRGTSILLAGASGTGKTTLACSFALSACAQGQKVLYVNYEVSPDVLIADMAGVGIDLQPAIDHGVLHVHARFPESAGVDEQLLDVFDKIDSIEPDHVVVNAISACERMGSEEAAFDFIVRLLTTCRGRGITCFFTNQTVWDEDITDITGAGISSLVDTLLVLRYVDDGRALHRQLVVVKSRGSRHSMTYRPLSITDRGIAIEPDAEFRSGPAAERRTI